VATKDPTRLGGTRKRTADPHAAVARTLTTRHPRLARLITLTHPLERTVPDARPITHLAVRTVVAQLVSAAAARTIMARLIEAHGSIDGVVTWAMAVPEDAPSMHGLSRAKRKAIAHWGRFIQEGGDPRSRWATLSADELLAEIMELRGFGRWSAQMLAIFGFGHPSVWPEGDAGVMRAARVVFKGMRQATIRRLIAGHESHVAICCWALLDNNKLGEFDHR
jgi:DNA-3-methyladenine glycosylase II